MNMILVRRFVLTVLLFAGSWAIAEPLVLTPFKSSGIYAPGERVGWKVALPTAQAPGNVTYSYTLKKNNSEVVASAPLEVRSGTATIETTIAEPAMLYLEIKSSHDGKVHQTAGAAVAPTKLQPTTPRPSDFDAFWEAKIKHLHTIAPEPVLTAEPSGKDGVEYWTIKMKNIEGAHVYGQLAKPAREGRFPAMLILQWASPPYPLEKSWVTDPAADGWLTLNVEPHDVPGNMPAEFYAAIPAMIKRYNTLGDESRDRSYFLQMYLGDYRAVDYLASRADWDGNILLVTGTSMGGQQSLAVAGLHPRVTHLIVHVPAGADALGSLHGRSAGYPNWDVSNPRVRETSLYFDTVNFAPRIKASSLVSMGFLDNVCPPAGIWTAFNMISGPKEAVPLVDAAHNHQATAEQQQPYTDRSNAWLAALVKGEEPAINAP